MKLTTGMIFVGLVLSVILPTASLAEIHKWKDANGAIHYGDQSPPGVSIKQINGVQSNNMNQIAGCGKPILTAKETQIVERELSNMWKRIPPQEMEQLKKHPLWSDFLLTVDAVKLYAQYQMEARAGDFARKFRQENRNKTKEFFQNNPELWNTLLRLQAADACEDKLDNEIVPKMLRRLDNTPFEKYFIPPSSNRFGEPTPAPSPDSEQ